MSGSGLFAQEVLRAGEWKNANLRIELDHDARFLRRKRLRCETGEDFLTDLPETVSLHPGDAFRLSDGRIVEIVAADEPLIAVRAKDAAALARLAWHIGNRHTPCQIAEGHLLIRQDHVLSAMLAGLGATLTDIMAPFRPEGGAYGLGRTMGHDHGHHADGKHKHVHHHGSHHHGDDLPDDPDI